MCFCCYDINGQSRGYDFIQFDNDKSAKNVIEMLDSNR